MADFKNVYQQKTANGFTFIVDHPDIRTFTTAMLDKNGSVIDSRKYTSLRWAMKRYYSLLANYGKSLYAALMK